MQVTITVILALKIALPATATLYVEVRDVSLLDALSITICTHVSSIEKIEEGGRVQTINFDVPAGDKKRSLSVWGHLSMKGSKTIEKEDFLTTQSYPVNEDVPNDNITIHLQRI